MAVDYETLKQQAAEAAVAAVKPGMIVGLGSGSTAVYAIRAIGQKLQAGQLYDILGIPTSETTAHEAQTWLIPLTTLADHPRVDVTIDGADEVDPDLNLIKGLGGALLREKIIATVSQQVIIVGDQRKRVTQLGSRAPVPVEVIPFAQRPATDYLESLGAKVAVRLTADKRPFVTDENNLILDCHFAPIANPTQLAQAIRAQPGIVEHGLFLHIATQAIIATTTGLEVLEKNT